MTRRPGEPLVLALDIGTSSVRAVAYDLSLRAVPGAESHLPHSARVTRDGGAELDVRALTRRVVTAIDQTLAGVPAAEFAAVGTSSFWHGLVATDGSLRPLTPAYLWLDSRAAADAERLRRRVPDARAHQRTGCRIHPTYWPAKIAWLRRTQPKLKTATVRWLSPADVVLGTLLECAATSSSLASGTGMYGLRRAGWDAGLLEAAGIVESALPEVSDEPRLGLLPGWRRRWPGLAHAVWAPPLGDGAAANLGSGCFTPRRRALTIGTSSAVRVTVETPPRRLSPSLWCYRAAAGRFIVGGALSAGGNLHRWLLDTLRLDAAPAVPLEHGLTFLPLLAGERGPGYALHATGAISGLTLATTPEDVLAAAMEAVALGLARIDRDLDRLLPPSEIVVASGAGLLANSAWMRVICDALNKPLAPSMAAEASSRGVALAALEAAGLAPRADDQDPGCGPELRPATSHEVRRHYDSAMARQTALYRVLVGGSHSGPRRGRRPRE